MQNGLFGIGNTFLSFFSSSLFSYFCDCVGAFSKNQAVFPEQCTIQHTFFCCYLVLEWLDKKKWKKQHSLWMCEMGFQLLFDGLPHSWMSEQLELFDCFRQFWSKLGRNFSWILGRKEGKFPTTYGAKIGSSWMTLFVTGFFRTFGWYHSQKRYNFIVQSIRNLGQSWHLDDAEITRTRNEQVVENTFFTFWGFY